MPYQHETLPQVTSKPICTACTAGYHDEVLVNREHCACPCHGSLNDQMEVTA